LIDIQIQEEDYMELLDMYQEEEEDYILYWRYPIIIEENQEDE